MVRLTTAIFRLANLEKIALTSGLSELLSPQVGRTIVWCLRHWTKSYLLPDENEYEQLSVTLISLFGVGTKGAEWTVGFLLDKVRSNLSGWSAESQIVEDTATLLLSLVHTRHRYVTYVYVNSVHLMVLWTTESGIFHFNSCYSPKRIWKVTTGRCWVRCWFIDVDS